MSILLFPFKILAVPGKLILGIVGVFFAACINAIIVRQLVCWWAWNTGSTGVTQAILTLVMVAVFIFTFVAAGDK